MKLLSNIKSYFLKPKQAQSYLALLLFAAFVIGWQVSVWESSAVSSTVGNRELPIYCVDTDEKKIALSFDAAWGNYRYGTNIAVSSSELTAIFVPYLLFF